MVTSVSSVEHFSAAGQELFFREAERVLVPGGMVAMTVSYLIGLNEKSLAVFSSHPLLKKEGFTILLVEQNFRWASTVADRYYVMEHGKIIDAFANAELAANMDKLHDYLGV